MPTWLIENDGRRASLPSWRTAILSLSALITVALLLARQSAL